MSKIPIIAITPEAEEDDDHNYLGMTDALTDVESLDSENDSKPKRYPPLSKLKIKITNSGGLTDVEDLDVSDCEEDTSTVNNKKKPVTLDDLDMNLDAARTEETCKTKSKGVKGKKRLHTQFSVTSGGSAPFLTMNDELGQGLTDVEDMCVSDNEEELTEQPPDYTITEEMLENTVLTKIAVKIDEAKSSYSLAPVPPKISVTDTEILDSDSNDERIEKINKKVKRRKPRTHRQINRVYQSLDAERHGRNTSRNPRQLHRPDDEEDKCTLKFVKRNVSKISIPQTNDAANTDVEILNSSADEMPVTVLTRSKVTDTDHDSLTDDEAYHQGHDNENIPIPEAYRKHVHVREVSDKAPVVRVSSLENSYVPEHLDRDYHFETDEEDFSDTDALLFADNVSIGTTPDISIFDDGYEHATETYKERCRTPFNDNLTDTEYLNEKPKKAQNSAYVSKKGLLAARELDDTDIENFAMSDVEEIDRIRSRSVTPMAIREIGSANISSKEGTGPFSSMARLEINRRGNYIASATVTPVVTDTEDMYVSAAEDEASVRPEIELPDGSSHVRFQSSRRINLDAPNDTIYLKGGDGFREVYTDVEDMNVTDTDDDDDCKYKKKVSVDILGDDKVLISMQNLCRNRKLCHTSAPSKNRKDWDASGKTYAERQVSRKGEKPLDAVQKGWQASPDATSPLRTTAPFRATHEERSPEDPEHSLSSQSGQQQRQVPDQHQLSDEMKQLLQDMEKDSKK